MVRKTRRGSSGDGGDGGPWGSGKDSAPSSKRPRRAARSAADDDDGASDEGGSTSVNLNAKASNSRSASAKTASSKSKTDVTNSKGETKTKGEPRKTPESSRKRATTTATTPRTTTTRKRRRTGAPEDLETQDERGNEQSSVKEQKLVQQTKRKGKAAAVEDEDDEVDDLDDEDYDEDEDEDDEDDDEEDEDEEDEDDEDGEDDEEDEDEDEEDDDEDLEEEEETKGTQTEKTSKLALEQEQQRQPKVGAVKDMYDSDAEEEEEEEEEEEDDEGVAEEEEEELEEEEEALQEGRGDEDEDIELSDLEEDETAVEVQDEEEEEDELDDDDLDDLDEEEEDDEEEEGDEPKGALRPLEMIDAQPGQRQDSQRSMFGTSGRDLYTSKNASMVFGTSTKGRKKKRRSRKRGGSGARVSKRANYLIGLANQHFIDQEFEEAIELCNQIAQENPKLPEPYHLLTSIWYERGDPEKEMQALQLACDLDRGQNINNYIRIADIGLTLGRHPKLDEMADGLLGAGLDSEDDEEETKTKDNSNEAEGETESKEAPNDDTSSSTPKRYTRAQRMNFLRTALLAVERILKRNSSVELMMRRGEIFEHLGDFKRAADVYRRVLKAYQEQNTIDLVAVHHLARTYRMRQELVKSRNVLEKFVGAVLKPTPDIIARVNSAATQARLARQAKFAERKRRREAIRKRKEEVKRANLAMGDSGMSVEQRLLGGGPENAITPQTSSKRKKRRGKNVKKKSRDGRNEDEDDDEDDDDDDSDDDDDDDDEDENGPKIGDDDRELQDDHITADGSNTILPEHDDEDEEEEEDEEEIVAKEVELEEQQLYAGINILSMLVEILLLKRQEYTKALQYLERFLEFTNSDGLCSLSEKNQWLHWERISPKINLDLVLMLIIAYIHVNNYSKALRFMQHIDGINLVNGNDARLLNIAFVMAESWMQHNKFVIAREQFDKLSKVEDAKGVFVAEALNQAAYCCESIEWRQDPPRAAETAHQDAVNYLTRLFDMLNTESVGAYFPRVELAMEQCLIRLERLKQRSATPLVVAAIEKCKKALVAKKAPQKASEMEVTSSSSSTTEESANDALVGAPRPPLPLSVSASDGAISGEQGILNGNSVSPFDTLNAQGVGRGSSMLNAATIKYIDQIHAHFSRNEFKETIEMSLPLFEGLLGDIQDAYTQFKTLCGVAEDDDSIKRPTEVESLNAIDSFQTLRCLHDFCITLRTSDKTRAAIMLLEKLLPIKARKVRGEGIRNQCSALFTQLCVHVQDFDAASKEIMDTIRRCRDLHFANTAITDWGDEMPELWQVLNGMLTCLRHADVLQESRLVARRLERLHQSGTTNTSGSLGAQQQQQQANLHSFGLLMLTAHHELMNRNPVRAIGRYYRARRMSPDSPLVALCLSSCYVRIYQQKRTQDRNSTVIKAFAQMYDYQNKRLKSATTPEMRITFEAETYYNFGRLAQAFGIPFLVEAFYRRVLNLEGASLRDKREAAINLRLHYRRIGNMEMARALTKTYLVM